MTMLQAALIFLLMSSSTFGSAAGAQSDASPAPNSASVAVQDAPSSPPPASQTETVVTDPSAMVTPALAAAADIPTAADTESSGDLKLTSNTLLVDETAAAGSTAEDATGASLGRQVTAALSPVKTYPIWDVIVIGAGLAGLKAAADLHAQGYRVVVFEGRNRIGGRVFSTKLAPSSTNTVELGAQWLHGSATTNPLYSVVTGSMGITPLLSDGDNSLRFTRNSSRVPAATVNNFDARHTAFTTYANNQDFPDTKSVQGALSDYITLAGLTTNTAANILAKQGLAYSVNTNTEQEFGASASWLGYNTHDEGVELGQDYVMPRTSNLTRIAEYISSGLRSGGLIKLEHNVTQVAYNATNVTVKVTNRWGTYTFTAQAAVVAIPLGVLKARGTSFFSPALSTAKQNAISRLGVGLLNKVVLEFPAAVANSGPFSSSADGGAEWINRLPEPNGDVSPGLNGMWQEFFVLKNAVGAPILVAFQAGQPAVTAETTMTDAQMVAAVMTQLRTWYGPTWPDPIPGRTLVTRWWRDPYAFGSYSYASTSCTDDGRSQPKERQAFGTPEGKVWFAGEHVSTQYPATMQGAYVTGQAAAAAIVAAGIQKTTELFG